ncbi:MAG: hypothetical protein KC549_17665 [Myxococcales bacterium]|nr:hypothetical protein [Myxococcales bacterium]
MNLLTASKRALAIAALLLGCDSGGGQTGTPDAAAPTGACCGATCSDSTESACVGQFVPATSCAAEPCPKGDQGACCAADGACGLAEGNTCLARGGDFQGTGTACTSGRCFVPEVGACCSPLGECAVRNDIGSFLDDHTWQGEGSTCDPSPCGEREVGACCADNGSCTYIDRPRCRGLEKKKK